MNKIAVFCSASDAIDPVFMEKARELGAWLGQHHKWLVYGGSNTGLMEVLAKVMVALPGGIGTLDEVFHVMAACSIGYHQKKVIFYNVEGFWNDMLAFLNRLEKTHFAHRPLKNYFEVANTLEELTHLLE